MNYNLSRFRRLKKSTQFRKFVEFIGNKPADEEFNYFSNGDCALAQFGKTLIKNRPDLTVSAGGFSLNVRNKDGTKILHKIVEMSAEQAEAFTFTDTFGEAHKALLPLVERK